MRKTDYSKSYNKKIVQEIVFNQLKNKKLNKLIGLAGPNIKTYMSFVKSKGIKQAEIYERDYVNLLYQMRDFNPPIKTTVLYQDIYAADLYQDTMYDLDFTCCINEAAPHIKKFKDNSIITISIRPIGFESTIKKFCNIISHIKPKIFLNALVNNYYKLHKIEWKNQSYHLYEYRDTTPMLTIIKN